MLWNIASPFLPLACGIRVGSILRTKYISSHGSSMSSSQVKCIAEIERRGLTEVGIYRVPG